MLISTLCLALAPSLVDQPQPWQEPAPRPTPVTTKEKNSIFSYTYAQLELVLGDGDGFSDGPDGLDLSGSYGIANNLFIYGGLEHLSGDVGATDVDLDIIKIGLGYHQPLQVQNTDLVLGFALLHADADPGGDDSGFELRGGVRNQTTEQLELDGTLGYTDFDDNDGNLFLELGGVYKATPQLGLLATILVSDDIDTFSLGVRFQP